MIGGLFWSLVLLGCAYALAEGEEDGRWAASLILAGSALTVPATRIGSHWASLEPAVLAVDTALLLGLYLLVLRSRRFFPIWIAGFQLIAVSTHLATLLAPRFTPTIYRAVESVWAVPVVLSMVIGIAVDRRRDPGRPSQAAVAAGPRRSRWRRSGPRP